MSEVLGQDFLIFKIMQNNAQSDFLLLFRSKLLRTLQVRGITSLQQSQNMLNTLIFQSRP